MKKNSREFNINLKNLGSKIDDALNDKLKIIKKISNIDLNFKYNNFNVNLENLDEVIENAINLSNLDEVIENAMNHYTPSAEEMRNMQRTVNDYIKYTPQDSFKERNRISAIFDNAFSSEKRNNKF
ncbi:MAG: hypothetical protein RR054_06000 [Clostridia bacterium]